MSQQTDSLSRIQFVTGQGNLPKVAVHTPWSDAEIYLHGAQVTHFKKRDEAPLLFLSQSSRFQTDSPIRGGIPICFPWFGPKGGVDGQPMHGFGRLKEWELKEVVQLQSGEVSLTFHWADSFEGAKFSVDYVVTVGKELSVDFRVTNQSAGDFVFEEFLHTYFQVGDIQQVSVIGLKGVDYLDKTDKYARKTETAEIIKISSEVDRTYLNTTSTVEIQDLALKRKIIVEKQRSQTSVVWNPWIERAKQMADLGDEEYKTMVCVESGNAGENKIKLPAGKTSSLEIRLRSVRL
ncbi:MAG: Aldose 1-epimerase [Verrucomicrobiales bacterium]|nr:Aldose 1-epimerase [Verrucomicrobiales bacterium]